MTPTDEARPYIWQRAGANVAAFFAKPSRLPAVVLAGMLVAGLPTLVGPAIGNSYKIGLDLQDAKCLPYTLYAFKMGGTDSRLPQERRFALSRGMFVSFIPHNNAMGRPELDGQRIVKIVAGLPGDTLEVRDDVAYINGKEWGRLWLLGSLGMTSGSLDRKTVVPPGKVLLMGTLNESYDGRYYGFIDQSEIVAQAFALF